MSRQLGPRPLRWCVLRRRITVLLLIRCFGCHASWGPLERDGVPQGAGIGV